MITTVDPYIIKTWDKVFKNGPIKICGGQPFKNLEFEISDFLKAVFRKFYLVHSDRFICIIPMRPLYQPISRK